MKRLPPLTFSGVKIDRYDLQGSIAAVIEKMKEGVRVFFVNAHCVNIAQESSSYREALAHAEFVFNDGIGIALAGFFLKSSFPENLNGTDWIPALLDILNAKNIELKVFLLGDRKDILEKTCAVFLKRWPFLQVVGTHHGYYEHPTEPLKVLQGSGAHLLIVGMGVPKQELFIDDHWNTLKDAGVRIAIGGGAIFKFMTGEIPRAPLWIRKCRVEWVWRLLLEPRRLWRRYLIGNFTFLKLIFDSYRSKK